MRLTIILFACLGLFVLHGSLDEDRPFTAKATGSIELYEAHRVNEELRRTARIAGGDRR